MLSSTAQKPITIKSTVVELWVCVIHISHVVKWTASPSALWDQVVLILKDKFPQESISRGEEIWKAVFLLSALSQMGATGNINNEPLMKDSWEVVAEACGWLDTERRPDVGDDKLVDKKSRYLFRRCVVLASQWGWDLRLSSPTLGMLRKIFLLRNYANLHNEEPNFPLFITDWVFLPQEISYDRDDKSFDIYLRLIIWTALAIHRALPQEIANKQIRKLISSFPRGTVQFINPSAPTNYELSQLYNRLTSTIVAFLLEPTPYTLKSRIRQARQFTDFQAGDIQSRHALIRAMMYFTVASVKQGMGCSEGLEWFSSITCCLITEFRALRDRCQIETMDIALQKAQLQNSNLLRMAFRAMVTVLEHSQSTNNHEAAIPYPDPEFLRIKCLVDALRCVWESHDATTEFGPDVGHYIWSFLQARAGAIPSLPRLVSASPDGSQDELFDSLDTELLENEEFNAAINGDESIPTPYTNLESQVAKVLPLPRVSNIALIFDGGKIIQEDLAQNIHLILKHATAEINVIGLFDIWADCWVGFAAILIKNGLRKWHDYIPQYAPDSWRRFSDPVVSRYAGMRFLIETLELSPKIYERNSLKFGLNACPVAASQYNLASLPACSALLDIDISY
ncbi:methyl methanesulfonate-sensitivity protein 22 [Cantharellus anzutake]|uniref:methyl methanesulfonate-sensitivity protein 22 n=1 Tax=Cantharellus anzutake TaxID=1750568 RepID=UPI001908A10B|nr:methyl methanesulfonate-sensitivity protein 22 [Cantharellus anzutake]KAF8323536.1 methyl methanesulfonate-sensitivity protein 22 [Cantharellus anzutake]